MTIPNNHTITVECDECNAKIPAVDNAGPRNYSAGIELVLRGGFGMFWDPYPDAGGKFILCENCIRTKLIPALPKVCGIMSIGW